MKKVNIYFKILFLFVSLAISIKTTANEKSDCPMEKTVFYTDDFSSLTSTAMKSKTKSNNWNVTSIIKNCFDRSKIGEAAWLMTADGETKLSVTLAYTGEDPRYKIKSQEVSFYFYNGSDFFNDEAKELITDIDNFVGSYTTENTEKSATVNLTAPNSFPYTTVAYYQFYTVIKVKFENGGTASVAKSIGISRPGVLILHGLNDSASTFQPMKKYLVESGAFATFQILTKDYSATNTSSFYANTHQNQVVKIGLYELSNNLFNVGIASTKYDMIGHSMGGILERLYNQEVDNKHTYKLITLNTPHFGAPLGNIAPTLFKLVNTLSNTSLYNNHVWKLLKHVADIAFNPNGGREAVSDLAIGSNAINDLNSYTASNLDGIPVYAIGTFFSDIEENDYSYSEPTLMTDEVTYLLAHIFYNDVPRKRYSYLLDNVIGDGIVSLESQRGGLNDYYCSMFSDAWKGVLWSNAFHCKSPLWEVTQNEIRLLLLSEPDAENFCLSGFGTTQQYNAIRNLAAQIGQKSKYITDFVEPKESSFIHLNISSVSNEQYSHTATISNSDDIITTIVFAMLSKDKMISEYDKSVMHFNLKNNEGDVMFYAIGRTNYNALVIDSVKVNLSQVNSISSPYQKQNNIKCYISDNMIKVEGTNKPYLITVYDLKGHVLLSQKNNTTHSYSLPINNKMYIVSIKTTDNLQTFKINSDINYLNQ